MSLYFKRKKSYSCAFLKEPILLLHNSGGDHHFFNLILDDLKKWGEVLLVDLPGHGQSNPIKNPTLSNIVETIFKACKDQGYKKMHLIGLNYGACLAIEWGFSHTDSVVSMALLDPPFQMPISLKQEIKNLIYDLKYKDHKRLVKDLIYALLPGSDSQVHDLATKAFLSIDTEFHQKVYEGLLHWDESSEQKLKTFKGPLLSILSDEHLCAYEHLKKLSPNHSEISKLCFSTCWLTLSSPEQTAAHLKSFYNRQCK